MDADQGSRADFAVSKRIGFERRHHPRRPACWRVRIRSAKGVELEATSVEISLGGMQLSLDRGALLRVCPRGHLTGRADALDLRLELQTQGGDDNRPIEVLARVLHVRRLSQFEYRLGVAFLEFSHAAGAQRLEHLLGRDEVPQDLAMRQTQNAS